MTLSAHPGECGGIGVSGLARTHLDSESKESQRREYLARAADQDKLLGDLQQRLDEFEWREMDELARGRENSPQVRMPEGDDRGASHRPRFRSSSPSGFNSYDDDDQFSDSSQYSLDSHEGLAPSPSKLSAVPPLNLSKVIGLGGIPLSDSPLSLSARSCPSGRTDLSSGGRTPGGPGRSAFSVNNQSQSENSPNDFTDSTSCGFSVSQSSHSLHSFGSPASAQGGIIRSSP